MDKQQFIMWARQLGKTYQASPATKLQLSELELIAVIGPTGVGKTTIIDALGLPEVKSDTTRDMRPEEKKNKNYYFRKDYDQIIQDIKDGRYSQFFVSGYDEFYGTRIDAYSKNGLCTMAIVAEAIPTFRQLGFKRVLPVYIMPTSYAEWMRRLGQRGHEELAARLQEAIASMKIALRDPEYKFVLNDRVEQAVKDIRSLISGLQVDEHRMELARDTVDILLERLGEQDDDLYFSPDPNPNHPLS